MGGVGIPSFSVNAAGELVATLGTIGGWEISEESLIKTDGLNSIEISSLTSSFKLLENSVERVSMGLGAAIDPEDSINLGELTTLN